MATEQIKVTSTSPSASTSTKTISYTNPDASNEQLAQLGRKLNALTDNSYDKTDRVITINCDTESGGGGKQTPTLTLSPNTLSLANIKANKRNITVSYDGDGQYGFIFSTTQREVDITNVYSNGSMEFFIGATSAAAASGVTEPFTVEVITTETDTYKAASATLTVTA